MCWWLFAGGVVGGCVGVVGFGLVGLEFGVEVERKRMDAPPDCFWKNVPGILKQATI
jgi:hypothetical protein